MGSVRVGVHGYGVFGETGLLNGACTFQPLHMFCYRKRHMRLMRRLLYKYDGKLFQRYTRNAHMRVMTECLFVEDGALVLLQEQCRVSHQVSEFQLWPDSQ